MRSRLANQALGQTLELSDHRTTELVPERALERTPQWPVQKLEEAW
jgi:hypothetical protein